MLAKQIQELVDFLAGNVMANADKADKGNKSAAKRLRKSLLNLQRQAKIVRLDAYRLAYGREPLSKGGTK